MRIDLIDFLLIGLWVCVVITIITFISIDVSENNKDFKNISALQYKYVVIENDTFKIITNYEKNLVLSNGTMIYYKDAYQYVRGAKR